MHYLALFVTAADFWAVLPVKLVAIAGCAYVLLQTLKRYFPDLKGGYAIAFNIAFNVAGVLMLAKPGDFESPTLWSSLALAIASAAGIHGTVKSLTGPTPPDTTQTAEPDPIPKDGLLNKPLQRGGLGPHLALVVVLTASLTLSGCMHSPVHAGPPPPLPTNAVDVADANAFKVLRPAHDFSKSISDDIISGKIKVSPSVQTGIESLNKALNVADHAERNYHKAGGGNPATMNAAVTAVLEAWTKAQASLAQLATN